MAVIFAVAKNEKIKISLKSLYEDLSDFIQGENYVEELTENATSLQDIVTEQYRKIKSTIKLEVEYEAGDVAVELHSDCDEASGDHKRCSVGDGVRVGYVATVTISESFCSDPAKNENKKIAISLKGLKGQSLTIDLACQECDCDEAGNAAAGECNGKGSLGNVMNIV